MTADSIHLKGTTSTWSLETGVNRGGMDNIWASGQPNWALGDGISFTAGFECKLPTITRSTAS